MTPALITQAEWICLAGNPPNIMSQQPPYWRARIGDDEEGQTFDDWRISGIANSSNVQQGSQQERSYLLWLGLFGAYQIIEAEGRRTLQVRLQDTEPVEELVVPEGSQVFKDSTVRIYGAPDRVRNNSKLWWRGVVAEKHEIDIARFVLEGRISPANFCPGENVTNPEPLRRLWLEVRGDVAYTPEHNAVIRLAPIK